MRNYLETIPAVPLYPDGSARLVEISSILVKVGGIGDQQATMHPMEHAVEV